MVIYNASGVRIEGEKLLCHIVLDINRRSVGVNRKPEPHSVSPPDSKRPCPTLPAAECQIRNPKPNPVPFLRTVRYGRSVLPESAVPIGPAALRVAEDAKRGASFLVLSHESIRE